jgi:secondary thiamine-phosphate synthase enzyme
MQEKLTFQTSYGLHDVTEPIAQFVDNMHVNTGLIHVFCQHTSCSLVITENADQSVKTDLLKWIEKHAPENDADYTHTYEGSDDMPAHIKQAITQTGLTIPIVNGRIGLGTWQGIYLWEHRKHPHNRSLVLTIINSE